jgi:hypothetical protein
MRDRFHYGGHLAGKHTTMTALIRILQVVPFSSTFSTSILQLSGYSWWILTVKHCIAHQLGPLDRQSGVERGTHSHADPILAYFASASILWIPIPPQPPHSAFSMFPFFLSIFPRPGSCSQRLTKSWCCPLVHW